MLFPQGCATDAYHYCRDEAPDSDLSGGYYFQLRHLISSLTEEEKETFDAVRETVEVKGESKSNLFSDLYKQGYKDGYAYWVASGYFHGRWSIVGDNFSIHLLATRELTPSHEAYGQGWDDGHMDAWVSLYLIPSGVNTNDLQNAD